MGLCSEASAELIGRVSTIQRNAIRPKGKTVMRLTNKVAIISGAASGMGRPRCGSSRAKGPGWSRRRAGRQRPASGQCHWRLRAFEPLDVTKEESWAAVVAATTRHFSKLAIWRTQLLGWELWPEHRRNSSLWLIILRTGTFESCPICGNSRKGRISEWSIIRQSPN